MERVFCIEEGEIAVADLSISSAIGKSGEQYEVNEEPVANTEVHVEAMNLEQGTTVNEDAQKEKTDSLRNPEGSNSGEGTSPDAAVMKCNETIDSLESNNVETNSKVNTRNNQTDEDLVKTAQVKEINEDIQLINKNLQAELARKVINTKEYQETERKVNDFNVFQTSLDLEQMDIVRLDNVSTMLRQIIASGKKKMSPKAKAKIQPVNPYAHIAAPPGYKERPPDIITDHVASSSNEKVGSKTHVTRSMKKEMLRNVQENG